MAEVIHEHPARVQGGGATYIACILAEERTDGTWGAWIEFRPIDKSKSVLRTGQETSQPNRASTEYWALGLEPIYLEGALVRAQERAHREPSRIESDRAS